MIQTDFVTRNLVARLFKGEVFAPSRLTMSRADTERKQIMREAKTIL